LFFDEEAVALVEALLGGFGSRGGAEGRKGRM
jgi:hypothetical protein